MILQSRQHIAGLMIIAAMASLSACSDETEPTPPASEHRPAKREPQQVEWLGRNALISPSQWLASRGRKTVSEANDPRVRSIEADLAHAHAIFRESERMIANRAVQLEGMLRTLGVEQDAVSIVADLVSIPGETGQTEGFGALSQQYFILRSGKTEREAALSKLKERYGPRR